MVLPLRTHRRRSMAVDVRAGRSSAPKVAKLWFFMFLRPFGVELLPGHLIVAAILYFPTVRFEVHRGDSLLLINEYDCAIQIDFLARRGGIISHKPLGHTGFIYRC